MWVVIAFALVLAALQGQAFAQPEVPSEPAAKPVEDPTLVEAKERFAQGVALAKAGNCDGAISELQASFDLVPRPNTLFNIAHCYEELFQYSLAIEAYEQFLKVSEPSDPERASVEATMRSLRNLLGTLHIKSNRPAEVWLGDRRVGSAPGEVLIPGGRHVVELRASGYLASRQEVVIAGRESLNLEFTLIIAQKEITITKIKSRGLRPLYFWGGTIATGLVFSGGLYFGLRAKAEDSRVRMIDARLPRDGSKIETFANIADSLFIGAAALAVGTAVTGFLTEWKPDEKPEGTTVVPSVGAGQVMLHVKGVL